MDYVCKVGTAGGEIIEQTFTAADEAALRSELEQKGYYLFSIRKGLRLEGLRLRRKRVATPLLLIFGQELAALLKAGLPLLQSLDVMLERQKDPLFRASLASIRERVKSGIALSEAFKTEGDLYPPILAASLVAGERSGSLEVVLRRFVQYLRLTQALKKKAISVSVYPIVLFMVMTTLVFVMLVYVIPQFQSFYEGLNAELPTPTRILMAVSGWMRENILWMVVGVVVAVVALIVWLRQPGSAIRVDGMLLRLPFVGRLMRMYATSQLARTLSTLLAGGLPLLNALEVAGNSIGNRAMAAAVSAATPQIREGKSLTTALESTGMLENLTLEMVKVGEQTGALGEMLGSVAEFYDEEVDTRLAAVLALVEPIMLVMMAFLVAGMLLAFYLPLFQAISAVQGGPR
jgi:type IV pilus assembly protein PilC